MPTPKTVHRVTVQTKARTADHPGAISYGYYTVAKGVLTMTDGDGVPMRRPNGEYWTHKLEPNDKPNSIACVLTREVRRSIHGQETFRSGPLRYPNLGLV